MAGGDRAQVPGARRGNGGPIHGFLNAHDRAAAREFYDSDAMTNVIVSRAKDRFIVVTTHGGVRLSRNIRTLLDYIEMYDPSAVVQSDIVSIFDVLYNAYSASLERYSRAKWADRRRSPAENVADQCLCEILAGTGLFALWLSD